MRQTLGLVGRGAPCLSSAAPRTPATLTRLRPPLRTPAQSGRTHAWAVACPDDSIGSGRRNQLRRGVRLRAFFGLLESRDAGGPEVAARMPLEQLHRDLQRSPVFGPLLQTLLEWDAGEQTHPPHGGTIAFVRLWTVVLGDACFQQAAYHGSTVPAIPCCRRPPAQTYAYADKSGIRR